jgi:hypothetical protein
MSQTSRVLVPLVMRDLAPVQMMKDLLYLHPQSHITWKETLNYQRRKVGTLTLNPPPPTHLSGHNHLLSSCRLYKVFEFQACIKSGILVDIVFTFVIAVMCACVRACVRGVKEREQKIPGLKKKREET